MVDYEAEKWFALSNTDGEYEEIWPTDMPVLPALSDKLPVPTAQEFTDAMLTFPANTGVGADNIAPRALARLPSMLIEALINMYVAAEMLGYWPECTVLVLIVLLIKAEGGFRPIGLFTTVVRGWYRVRAEQFKK